MPHAFFNSYAKLDNNKTTRLGTVIDELRELVRGKLGAASLDEVGFFDTHAIEPGVDWKVRMAKALSHSRVLVCFCSRTYFNREFCGKEFEVFRRRVQLAKAGDGGRYIIPVLWDKCDLPEAVKAFQFTHASLPREYVEDGLLTVKRVIGGPTYKATLTALANAVHDAVLGEKLPAWPHPIDFDQLPAAFDNPGRYNVRLTVFQDAALRWTLQPGKTVRDVVEGVVASLKVPWTDLRPDVDVVQRLREASVAREAVVVLTDEASSTSPPWAQYLDAVDAAGLTNWALLVGRDPPAPGACPAVTSDALLSGLVPATHTLLPHAVFQADEARSLDQALTASITRLRMALVAEDPVVRVTNAELEEGARKDGIDLGAPPLVTGPRG